MHAIVGWLGRLLGGPPAASPRGQTEPPRAPAGSPGQDQHFLDPADQRRQHTAPPGSAGASVRPEQRQQLPDSAEQPAGAARSRREQQRGGGSSSGGGAATAPSAAVERAARIEVWRPAHEERNAACPADRLAAGEEDEMGDVPGRKPARPLPPLSSPPAWLPVSEAVPMLEAAAAASTPPVQPSGQTAADPRQMSPSSLLAALRAVVAGEQPDVDPSMLEGLRATAQLPEIPTVLAIIEKTERERAAAEGSAESQLRKPWSIKLPSPQPAAPQERPGLLPLGQQEPDQEQQQPETTQRERVRRSSSAPPNAVEGHRCAPSPPAAKATPPPSDALK